MDDILGRNIVIVRDFNINWLSDNIYKKEIEHIASENMCKQLVNQPTRIEPTSSTIIDYVISNIKNCVVKVDNSLKISDHETIVIIIKVNVKQTTENAKYIKVLKYNKSKFIQSITRSDISRICALPYVNSMHNIFEKELIRVIDKFMVLKSIKLNDRNKWYTNNLKVLKRQKVESYFRFIHTGLEEDWDLYKRTRNNYKNALNKTKSEYIKNKINNASDQKTMWKTIKSLVLKDEKVQNRLIEFEGIKFNCNETIANNFNNFFY